MSLPEPITSVAERYASRRYGSQDDEEYDEIWAPVRLLDDRNRLADFAVAILAAEADQLHQDLAVQLRLERIGLLGTDGGIEQGSLSEEAARLLKALAEVERHNTEVKQK